MYKEEILLDCDQSNVLLARIILSCILLSAFSLLLICIRDPASIWDRSNIILMWLASRSLLEIVSPSIWHSYGDMAPQRWQCHDLDLLGLRDVIGHVTIWLAVVDFLLVVHCDHASIWHRYEDMAVWNSSRKALPGTEVGRRSVLNITLISYTPLRYVRNVACEE